MKLAASSTERGCDAPVIVLGGGVIGVCCAYSLSGDGVPIVLLEKDELCSGCSFGNLGLLAASHSVPLASPGTISKGLSWMFNPKSPFGVDWRMDKQLYRWLWQFCKSSRPGRVQTATAELAKSILASVDIYKEYSRMSGFTFGLEQRGLLELFVTAREFARAQRSTNLLRSAGLRVDLLDRQEVKALEPRTAAGVVGGLRYHDDGHILPAKFVRGLAAVAVQAGAVIHEKAEVLNFRVSNNRITAVETNCGIHEASAVVLATGSASPRLAQKLGLRLPVQPGRGYTFTVRRESDWPLRPLMFAEAKVMITPMGDDLRVGGTLELTEDCAPVNLRRARSVTKKLHEYILPTISIDEAEPWSGFRPCSPDGFPLIGWSRRYPNLLFATGHGMLGMTLGPLTGQIVSQLVRGKSPALDLGTMSPNRFGDVI